MRKNSLFFLLLTSLAVFAACENSNDTGSNNNQNNQKDTVIPAQYQVKVGVGTRYTFHSHNSDGERDTMILALAEKSGRYRQYTGVTVFVSERGDPMWHTKILPSGNIMFPFALGHLAELAVSGSGQTTSTFRDTLMSSNRVIVETISSSAEGEVPVSIGGESYVGKRISFSQSKQTELDGQPISIEFVTGTMVYVHELGIFTRWEIAVEEQSAVLQLVSIDKR
jgi:hypothetical protein